MQSRQIISCATVLMLVGACSDDPLMEIGPRSRSSAALRQVGSCDELTGLLRAHVKEQMRVQLLQQLESYQDGPMALRGGFAEDMAAAPSAEGGGRQEGVDYSGTNNQESGVDEADFLKTDGYYIYVLNGDGLEILAVPEFGELERRSHTTIEGYPSQLLLAGDRAVVFSAVDAWQLQPQHPLYATLSQTFAGAEIGWWRIGNITKVTVLDIADRAAPAVLRELYLEGYYQTARKVDTSVRMVSYAWMEVPDLIHWIDTGECNFWDDVFGDECDDELEEETRRSIRHNNRVIDQTPLAAFVPQIYEVQGGTVVEHAFTDADCQSFALADDAVSRGFTSLLSLDLFAAELAFDADHVLSNQPVVYASTDTLLLVEPAEDWWWYWRNDRFDEATNVHRFDISVAGQSSYTGSGRIDGTVLNQFSVSEHEDYVRLASTTGQWNRWWLEDPEPSNNHVFVLAGTTALETVGHLGNIARGEQIWSARFVGEKAFLVTFRNIDPLWTIDLSNPAAPRIEGELEVPGVSTYIHPLAGDRLLTIGFGGDSGGLDWTTRVSLFDVTNFAAPALAASLPLGLPGGDGWSWSWSEATYEHKAFQYWEPLGLLAVPVSSYRYTYTSYEYYSRLELVSVAAGLSRYGAVDHSSYYGGNDGYWYNPEVRRSIFMGDFIYAISDRAVTAHRLSDLTLSAMVTLPGYPWGYGWY